MKLCFQNLKPPNLQMSHCWSRVCIEEGSSWELFFFNNSCKEVIFLTLQYLNFVNFQCLQKFD